MRAHTRLEVLHKYMHDCISMTCFSVTGVGGVNALPSNAFKKLITFVEAFARDHIVVYSLSS